MNHTRNIVRLLIAQDDAILLARAQKGFFFLPGGGIEYNESLRKAASRELEEELAISTSRILNLDPIGIYEHS